MAIETVEIDSKGMFDAAMADEPETAVETQTERPVVEAPVRDEKARDEQGRFAPKAEPSAPVTAEPAPQETQAQPDNTANVPSWRLREVNEAKEAAERRYQDSEAGRIALERRLAELERANQPKQEPIDFFTDPNAALKQQLTPFEQQLQTMQSRLTLRASRAEAIADHGRAAVTEMEQAIDKAMNERHPDMGALAMQMRQSDDPIGVAMNWYRRDKLLKETGGDITAYRAKTLDEALKDPAFLAKAIEAAKAQASGHSSPQTQPNTVVQLPPSLSRATSAASPHEDQGDMSDRSIWKHALG